jgi:AcrR family transcriptional regulator
MSDSRATRELLLDAATTEFVAVGLAGARVDRIADAAGVNKSQLYYYFKSKGGLFDAVLRDSLKALLDDVPLDGEDLPGYAVQLYDYYVERPELLRLATWNRLERVPKGDLFADFEGHNLHKLQAIADAQRGGWIDPTLAPSEAFSLVVAMAMTWSPVNVTYASSADDAESEHARRRAVLREAVSRALVPND